MTDQSETKALWDVLNACRVGVLGRLNHSEIEALLADLDMHGYQIVKKPESKSK